MTSPRSFDLQQSSSAIMNELEAQREANIKRNKAHLDQLGILHKAPSATVVRKASARPPTKKRKLDSLAPLRVSARLAAVQVHPSYAEDEGKEDMTVARGGRVKSSTKAKARGVVEAHVAAVPEPALQDTKSIRAGWTAWEPSSSEPTRDEDAKFHFADQPTFTPNKSPEEMLREGCFGGSYFRPLYSRRLAITVEDDYLELPSSWIEGIDVKRFLTSPDYDADINKYKVKCGQSIEEWEAAGWIDHHHDVRGWFQWYCRFFMGRRCDDDERQVSRWRKCAGETGRWRRALLKKYKAMGVREVFDDGEDEEQDDVSPVMHQTCFQWAFEVRQGDLDRYWATGT